MDYLKNVLKVCDVNQLQDTYEDGILIISDNQAVIDTCQRKNIPVAAFEHDYVKGLKCNYVLINPEYVEDEEFENIYRRCKGIPLFIAETKRCYLRELSLEDLDALEELYKKPGITTYMEPLFPYDEEREYQKNYIRFIYEMSDMGIWLVINKETGRLIGRAGIEVRENCFEERQAELGYAIDPDEWRKGYAFEVCSEIIALAFNKYDLSSVIARSHKENTASKELLKKLGFSFCKDLGQEDMYILRRNQ